MPYLEKAYQLDPSEVDYGVVLASAYFGTNQTEKWKRLYEELSETFPFEPELWLDWGVALYENGEAGDALDITETGLENNPQSIQLLYRLAALFYLTGNKDMALMVLEKALEFDATEYTGMFTFAPELKNSLKILTLIGKYTQGK
jgi:tetratricopeptide (TPR) repeat protein